ncbi:3-phosphoshikimate 1-carboxyvinyltransferase [Candidatus Methylopumilus universalis]|jgi:3-phosphoshikimate 1-carboxyvinyltransferase|uniref:3-phosphoshikimate 1-carboxyvinyltransferase n=1 Tax=Candidatus Methylopumilus universalis TaxID=2588536 RepID=UPI00111E1472|nr:3-phosphoshikimate 1-carboxyvinyltransferase [Candidatus Methylopumilus universalis]QDC80141.1 3-phosphoshikimate 1-carboxyvinyltransferase [Candidatus Methylopumilus universalis]QDC81442.1 3-phosphoshikimate 1-carboxyvinyltransferase [Candidatus Methylopumilus universalis]QDC87881.1 3-phosphoshikimate 1-carboxyvinyltransferase [Candidatus Methylopumilus universalis]
MTNQKKLKAVQSVSGQVTLPGSKSITNRILLLSAIADGATTIIGPLVSDDTLHMIDALKKLQVDLTQKDNGDILIHGTRGNFKNKSAEIFLGNAGTAFRPLTAALSFSKGQYTLSGLPRMHERPIKDLVDALLQLNADITYLGQEGYPPLKISPSEIMINGPIKIRGDISSQFLTSLLMAMPLTKKEVVIEIEGDLISKPYIDITLNLMARFGIHVKKIDWKHFVIPGSSSYVSPGEIFVEGDASSASYFLAAGALAGDIEVKGIGRNSIQGDVKFAEALVLMGADINILEASIQVTKVAALQAINLDCNHIPDAAMTLAVLALFAKGTTKLLNIGSWRVKETDRIKAMATELRKLGAAVTEGNDFIEITPPLKIKEHVEIDTYDDHRMAMCFSLVSLRNIPITINDPACVNKTFPTYFEVLESIVKT